MAPPDACRELLRTHVRAGAFPGAAWGLLRLGAARPRVTAGAVGRRIVTGPVLPVRQGTLFDLASLTKPLATALVALRLVARGALDLDAPNVELLPELGRRALGRLTAIDLLAHRAGLAPWHPLYLSCRTLSEAVAAVGRLPLAAAPRTKAIYSDLGYILLGAALERAGTGSLPALFLREVTAPLGIRTLLFRPTASLQLRCAATETGNRHERAMVGRRAGAYRGFRTGLIWGEVHDHNAYALGGACGHAGLFGDVAGVLRAAGAILGDPPSYLPGRLRRLLFRDLTRGLGGHRTAGFQLATDPGSTAGPAFSRRAVGHTGFTGTSLWIDPQTGQAVVLLTSRMHPSRSSCDMHAIRRGFHEVALSGREDGGARWGLHDRL